MMSNLERSLLERPRTVYVLYHNPLLEHVLDRQSQFQKVGGSHQYSIFEPVCSRRIFSNRVNCGHISLLGIYLKSKYPLDKKSTMHLPRRTNFARRPAIDSVVHPKPARAEPQC